MKRFSRLLLTFSAALASACGGSSGPVLSDFTTEIYTPAYASGFDIRGNGNNASTLVSIRNPWQGGTNVEQHLLILRDDAKAPADFAGQVVKAPVRHVVCMSSSHVAMFDAIGQAKRISGVSGIDYISNPYVREHRLCGEVRDVGYDTNPAYSPDGKYVAWLSMARNGYESDRTRLCVLDLKTGAKTYVTEAFQSGVDGFCWAADSRSFYFTGVWQARSMVHSTNLKGEVRPLTTGDFDYGAGLALCGKNLIVTRHSISAPDDIYSLSFKKKKNAEVRQLTRENQYFQERLKMGEVKERWVATTDGKKELCWVVYPPHFDPSKKYPVLLFCEGGPQSPVSQFWSYRWNLQIMSANDYIVIAPNRRGLPGFGMEWLEEISGDYSGQCMQDYLSAIDDICKEPYADKDRLGCVGASFGGYSVYYLAGHHDKRFKCFISHDGIFNTQQQYYETEEMWFPNWDLGAGPWRKGISADPDNTEKVDDQQKVNPFTTSPHLYVDRWDTPILCIHGEKDYRILSSQGQSAFSAAVMRGIPAELLLYPDENHWVLKPQNGILWQRTFFRWLDRWLKK